MRPSAGAALADVVVVGGGVIGLSIAWRVRQRGATVIVVERGALPSDRGAAPPDGQAGWAAAGMLAPLAETGSRTPLLDLGLESLALYSQFVEELAAATGVPVALQGPGMLRLAQTPARVEALQKVFAWQRSLGLSLEWIEAEDVRRMEPALDPGIAAAVFSPKEKSVDPRTLLCALEKACVSSGVQLVTETPVVGLETSERRVAAVRTADGNISCGELVLAAGAWTPAIARMLDLVIPVVPLRGQMVALACPGKLSHTVYSDEGYLVPREDGKLLVGATEENVGFELRPTVGGISGLLGLAGRLLTDASPLPFHSAWAGLRPASPDHLPILGSATGWANLHLATGHFRNGILLTPVTARIMAAWITERESDPLLRGVELNRFSSRESPRSD